MIITIDDSIKKVLPNFTCLALSMDVVIKDSSEIDELIKKTEERISEEYTLEEVLSIPLIKEARDGYKKLGKDPSRYRLACESLLRRIVKGNKLYRINNVVDCGNILSIDLFRSVCVCDLDEIKGDILIRRGLNSDIYEGIGRGIIDVSNIPLYCDDISPFGSPTSDTIRTSIKDSTKRVLVMVICFESFSLDLMEITTKLYEKYCFGKNIKRIEVRR